MAAQFGRRLRRGATTTAVAAVAIAALSASQAPGVIVGSAGAGHAADASPPSGTPVTGNSPYYTDLPPLNAPVGTSSPITTPTIAPVTGAPESGIPASVLAAYKLAEASIARTNPGCNLPWQLLAAIGKVESGQARGGAVDANGTASPKILGPKLNGAGFANIPDTDHGVYDGDSTVDRAVGPMQFIPGTWATWGQDANGDGVKDPNNIYDAAQAAGLYLCAGNRDLATKDGLHTAILGYNHSQEYLTTVLSWFEYYKNGTYEVPDGTGVLPSTNSPSSSPTTPAGQPGGGSNTPSPSSTPTSTPPSTPTSPPSSTPTAPPASTPPSPPATTQPPVKPQTPPVVPHLVNAGTGTLTATAGSPFTERAAVRAVDDKGASVEGVKVQFEIVGTTDALFSAGTPSVTVTTGKDGLATAPAVRAGEETGDFTVRATVPADASVAPLAFPATVTARQADVLAAGDTTATAAPGASFAAIEVKATFKGEIAPGVLVSATIASDDATAPYFGDAGTKVRVKELKTDANGNLQIPEITAGDTAGTYTLILEAAGGGTLKIQLTVTAPEPSDSPSPSDSPEPSDSPSPSEGPAPAPSSSD